MVVGWPLFVVLVTVLPCMTACGCVGFRKISFHPLLSHGAIRILSWCVGGFRNKMGVKRGRSPVRAAAANLVISALAAVNSFVFGRGPGVSARCRILLMCVCARVAPLLQYPILRRPAALYSRYIMLGWALWCFVCWLILSAIERTWMWLGWLFVQWFNDFASWCSIGAAAGCVRSCCTALCMFVWMPVWIVWAVCCLSRALMMVCALRWQFGFCSR